MSPPRLRFHFESIAIDANADQPLYRQLENQVRWAIAQGLLTAGSQVPSTRELAKLLGLSRNTVTAAYDQLLSEGYLEARIGSGTRVTTRLPDTMPIRASWVPSANRWDVSTESLSFNGRMLQQLSKSMPDFRLPARPFRPHLPDLASFPATVWNRFASEQARFTRRCFDTGDPQGYEPLRTSIADYMAVSRGVQCTQEQVIITSGAQQGLTLIANVLLDHGDTLWVEEPGNLPANQLLQMLGMDPLPVPLDDEGIDLTRLPKSSGSPKLIYVTPSSQWPMSMTMSVNRRLALLTEAERRGSWIVEDDYNGEYRYSGRPHPALCSLDAQQRTIYLGTFSKYLFPAIRLGFLIVPVALRSAFVQARWLLDRYSPTLSQQVLHRFIESGEFLKHLRKMRIRYQSRRDVLHGCLTKHFQAVATTNLPDTGMHLVLAGNTKNADDRLIAAAARMGLEHHTVQSYSQLPKTSRGLILGFAAFDEKAIEEVVRTWANEFSKAVT